MKQKIHAQTKTYPYSLSQFLLDNPSVSFPKDIPETLFIEYGVYPVFESKQPAYDEKIQRIQEDVPELINGLWTQVWSVVNLTAAEVVEQNDSVAASVRAKRNILLSDCDWTQVADAPVDKAVWASYRQALRDISKQPGFPWSVTWPVAP